MSKVKVRLFADNHFKYKLEGSVAWIALIGNIEHEIEFNEGDRVEVSSIKSVSKLKIRGAIKEVDILSSDITNLDGAFEGTRELDTATVRSSVDIVSMDSTFKDSGVVTFDIQTSSVINMDDAFNGTHRIEEIEIDTRDVNSMNRTFLNSNVKKIANILPFKGKDIDQIFVGNKNLDDVDGLDLSNVSDSTLKKGVFTGSDKLITGMDISFFRGQVSVRKRYFLVEENKIDDTQLFEIDIDGEKLEISKRNLSILYQDTDDSFDFSRNEVEIDLEPQELEISTRDSTDVIGDVESDNIADGSLNLEMDITAITLENQREAVDIDKGLTDNSSDQGFYQSEIDMEMDKNSFIMDNRANQQMEPTGSDDSSDNSNEFEMDIERFRLLNMDSRHPAELSSPDSDDSSNLSMYNLEMDIDSSGDNNQRGNREVILGNIDDSIDDLYELEIDIDSSSENIDPLDDGSCIYYLDKRGLFDLIGQAEVTLLSTLRYSLSIKRFKGIDYCRQKNDVRKINITSPVVNDLSYSNISMIIQKEDNGGNCKIEILNRLYITVSYTTLSFRLHGDSTFSVAISTTDSFILTMTRDGDNFKVYIDTTLVIESNHPVVQDGSILDIKTHSGSNSSFISNYKIFNRTLTYADVLNLNDN